MAKVPFPREAVCHYFILGPERQDAAVIGRGIWSNSAAGWPQKVEYTAAHLGKGRPPGRCVSASAKP